MKVQENHDAQSHLLHARDVAARGGQRVRKPVGVVTDRDIACRAIAAGRDALSLVARDCMSSPCVVVTPEMSFSECCDIMEENKVRRVLVVDSSGGCCGIGAQADLALRGRDRKAAEAVREISRPTVSASTVT
jgi:CBS domain-containing protein